MNMLYNFVPSRNLHTDERGFITSLLNTGAWREVNIIHSDEGSVRGRHYHRETEECFIVLSGRIRVVFRLKTSQKEWLVEEREFKEGDVFIVYPLVEHTFHVLNKAKWINLLSTPLASQSPDFYRYDE